MGNETLSQVFRKLGVQISDTTIGRIWAKVNTMDDLDVSEVGIDDIALDKGQDYATVIYDLLTHDLIALLEGRDGTSLKEWLGSHRKVSRVARDRSSAYSAAVSDVLPDAEQVADRFHLVQNMISYVREEVKEIIPGTVVFKDGDIVEGEIPKEWAQTFSPDSDEVAQLSHYDNEPPVDPLGTPINYDKKLRDLSSKQYQRQAEGRKKVAESILRIQSRYRELLEALGKRSRAIAQLKVETGHARETLEKYIRMTPEEVQWKAENQAIYKKRKTPMDDAHNIVYKMLADGIDPALIYSSILKRFPDIKPATVRNHIQAIARNNFQIKLHNKFALSYSVPEGFTKITRPELVRQMTKKAKEPEKPEERQRKSRLEKIMGKYPKLRAVQESYLEFHGIIMGGDPSKLDGFLTKHEGSFLDGLAKGIKKDIAAVRKAISSPVSSGPVEGGNHKVKCIKRAGYGRNKIKSLFKKCFLAFKIDSENFNILDFLGINSI
jgi:transposase